MSIVGPNQFETDNLLIDGDLNLHNNKIIGLSSLVNKFSHQLVMALTYDEFTVCGVLVN